MIELVQGKKHQVIKRSGVQEPYNKNKMKQVLMWACDNKEAYVNELLEDITLKVYDKISIQKLFNEVIETTANKISDMYPVWDDIAKKLYIQKIYKEIWGIKRSEYPYYGDVLSKGAQYNVYDPEVINTFSTEEIKQLDEIIQPKRDFDLSYLGLRVFIDKQSKKYTMTKPLELPQHGFMRLAMFAFWKEKENRIELIEQRYNDMSTLLYSEATPKWMNSLSKDPQMASCVVSKIPDTSWGINKTISNLGLFSKYGGGLAADVSSIRATGSKIGKSGISSGPVPFIKMIEATVSAYNQNGTRPGACAVYFSWWHYDSPEMLELKEEGGAEDRRARNLKYGVKWNKLFTQRILDNEDITLFDPKDTPELLTTHGEEFNKWYNFYENKDRIRKRKMKASDLAFSITKQRIETGNIYIFFEESTQEQNLFKEQIFSSNLCGEISIPAIAPSNPEAVLTKDFDNNITLSEDYDPGMIALCNLSSINVIKWDLLSDKRKDQLAYNLLRASDNLLDYAYYPSKEGEVFNKNYRSIGIGITNYTQWLAKNNLKSTEKETLKRTNDLLEGIYYHLMKNSIKLAKERGRYMEYFSSEYAKGNFIFDLYQGPYNFKLKHDWKSLKKDLLRSGSRFSTLMAIAPTATSSLILDSTEGIEFPRQLVSLKTGTYTCKQLVPNIKKLRSKYELAWDVDSLDMINLSSVRQRFIDQGQSLSLYYKDRNESASEVLKDIIYAEKMGLKSLYYAFSLQDDIEEECESCSA